MLNLLALMEEAQEMPFLAFAWLYSAVVAAGGVLITTIGGVVYKVILVGGRLLFYVLERSSGSIVW